MAAQLAIVDLADATEWDSAIGRQPDASIYAARPWGTYKSRIGWAVRRIAIRAGEGEGEDLAYIQYQQRRRGPGRFILAQGCPILTPLGESRAEAVLQAFLAHLDLRRSDLVGVNYHQPERRDAVLALLAHGFTPVVSARNHTLELDLAQDLDAIRARMDPRWRANLRKAERNGDLSTHLLSDPEERLRAFDGFSRMYAALKARKGFSSTLDTQAYRDVAASDPRVAMLEVRERGEPILIRIAHRTPTRWTDFFAASNERARATHAAPLAVWRCVEQAKADGHHVFDFGGIDPAANRGVFDFKRGLCRNVVQSAPLWLYGRSRLLRDAAAAFLARR
ncbi:lipid II:glycine glycyltransferase FemX [Methylobacterium sp. ID0610]|uniref:lipid II:glycine glycyltransferase FemX n=1 Tax=Methylobacterium carpenticola TaxID=3344827 RepID=UPI00367BBF02